MRAAADEVDRLEVLEAVAGPQVEHLGQVVGQVEGRAQVDLVTPGPSRPGVTICS